MTKSYWTVYDFAGNYDGVGDFIVNSRMELTEDGPDQPITVVLKSTDDRPINDPPSNLEFDNQETNRWQRLWDENGTQMMSMLTIRKSDPNNRRPKRKLFLMIVHAHGGFHQGTWHANEN